MKHKLLISQIFFSAVLLIVSVVILNPMDFLMSSSMEKLLIVILIASFLLLVSTIWNETARDEREQSHKQFAGRISFLVGTSILFLGILIQGFHHNVDPWLIYALAGMVLSKIASRIYSQFKM